jgi:hypothetical protein
MVVAGADDQSTSKIRDSVSKSGGRGSGRGRH